MLTPELVTVPQARKEEELAKRIEKRIGGCHSSTCGSVLLCGGGESPGLLMRHCQTGV